MDFIKVFLNVRRSLNSLGLDLFRGSGCLFMKIEDLVLGFAISRKYFLVFENTWLDRFKNGFFEIQCIEKFLTVGFDFVETSVGGVFASVGLRERAIELRFL